MAKNQIRFNVSVYEPFGVSQSYYYFRRAVYEQCRLNFGNREKARPFHTISPRNLTSIRSKRPPSPIYIIIICCPRSPQTPDVYYLNDGNSQTSRLKVDFDTPKDMYSPPISLPLYILYYIYTIYNIIYIFNNKKWARDYTKHCKVFFEH